MNILDKTSIAHSRSASKNQRRSCVYGKHASPCALESDFSTAVAKSIIAKIANASIHCFIGVIVF